MGIKQVKLDVNEVIVGMYVSGLDRPWNQTPFPLQGFFVRDLDEIKLLRQLCQHVYIDAVRGRPPLTVERHARTSPNTMRSRVSAREGRKKAPANVKVAPLRIQRNQYPGVEPLKKEVKKARQLHQNVYHAVGEVLDYLGRNELHRVPMLETKRLAGDMVDSVLRNPDAFTWLSRVQEKDEHTYSHAIRSSVWAILFGRHIGLPKRDLDVLAMGVLLKDVGKIQLDQTLIAKPQRSPEEEREYETFVEKGVEILRRTPGVEPRVISVVKTHCERLNGSGFPLRLQGDKIPLLGKIAGVVTFYDNTTNPRGAQQPIAPSKAVSRLYELRDTQFQEELVVEFIRAIGLYPTGTLVELSTGEVAVVVEQNFERRLKPKVLLVRDPVKELINPPELLDLAEDDKHKQGLIDSGRQNPEDIEKIEIARDLEPGSYDVDITQVRDDYLMKKEASGILNLLSKLKP